MATTETPWAGNESKKHYVSSGQFSITLKNSLDYTTIAASCRGIEWDGVNTVWIRGNGKTFLQSGYVAASSTLKTSMDVSGISADWSGCGTDANWDTLLCSDGNEAGGDHLYLYSGQFSSTIKSSLDINPPDNNSNGISFSSDGHTLWIGYDTQAHWLQSGEISATVKSSVEIGAIDNHPSGISWDGNTIWGGKQADKFYLHSGHTSTTIKTSLDTSSIDNNIAGITTNDSETRTGAAPPGSSTFTPTAVIF